MLKLECAVEKIKNAVSQTEKITGKNLTLPILNSILLIASGRSLKLRSTNLSLGIEVEIPVKIEKEGVVAVLGSVLTGIFSNINQNENISLEEENGNLLIKTKKNKLKIKGQPHEDFPTIPIIDGKKIKIDSRKFIDGIRAVYYSSSTSDIKPEIASVYIYSNEDDLIFVSTDSFRLAEKKIKIKNLEEVPGILIPFKNISEIIRIFGEVVGEISVCFNKNQISLSCDGIYLTTRVVDGVFPDYKQIIPKESKTEVVVLKQDLLNALKLSNIFSDKFNQVNMVVKPKEKIFEISSSNNDVGENKTSLDGALSGEGVELGFNYKYFLDLFQSINSDSISIKLNQNSHPMVVSGVSDNTFIYLIMPMNK
jgi:DNA polymerase III subunit beta